jgi:hypothetical protein
LGDEANDLKSNEIKSISIDSVANGITDCIKGDIISSNMIDHLSLEKQSEIVLILSKTPMVVLLV